MAREMARWHLDIVDAVRHDRLVGSLGLGDSLAGAVRDVLTACSQPAISGPAQKAFPTKLD